MVSRREFLKRVAAIALSPFLLQFRRTAAALEPDLKTGRADSAVWVNDIHSQLNLTRVAAIEKIGSLEEARKILVQAARTGRPISVSGGRHAGGGQQFLGDEILLDITPMNRVIQFDRERGLIEVESGIQWPALIEYLVSTQTDLSEGQRPWAIRQKQTGADHLTIGGAVSSNIHSRGLGMKPFIEDVESLKILDADGNLKVASRKENPGLFKLAVGGYGLFGLVYSVTLRLVTRRKVVRVVERMDIDDLVPRLEDAQARGCRYGDFQFNIDEKADNYLTGGIFAAYLPVLDEVPIPENQKSLSEKEWVELVTLGHTDKGRAFEKYVNHYLATDGQVYWSDTHQLGPYREDYHKYLDQKLHAEHPATEAITELYVPREKLPAFMRDAREDFRKNKVDILYGTIRLIEKDDESYLAWAKKDYACIIFNLHTVHTPEGVEHSAEAFRRLIDLAIRYGGSYYLTYHRFARKDQVLACYQQFSKFLRLKRKYDPQERFQSDWYRHYKQMFT